MLNLFSVKRFVAFALPAAIFVGGCGSSGQAPEATKAVDSITDVSKDMGKGHELVDKVNASIDQLQAGGDLKAAFANYRSSVADIEAAGKRVADRRVSMQANRAAYVDKWQKEQESIENADVRAALASRKDQVAAKFDSVSTSMDKVRENYQPFLKDLQEIQKGLALDLNPAGVAAMKTPLDRAKAEGAALKASIATVQSELDAIAGSMSAKAATPAK